MKKQLIYKGIVLNTSCKYLWCHKGKSPSFTEARDVCEIVWVDSNSRAYSDLFNLKHVGRDQELEDMGKPTLIPEITVSLNGITLKKLTWDSHIIRIVIVQDSDSKVIQDYWHTTVVVSQKDYQDPEFVDYIFWSGGLKYLTPSTPKKLYSGTKQIYNFPKIIIQNRSLTLESNSQTIYSLRNKYDEYLIRSIDYQEQFFTELRKILDEYGIQLVRYNREETVTTTAYISYRISSTPTKYNHPKYADVDDTLMQHTVPIDFEFRCVNMQMFYDFKNRFNNVDLVSNFCEFKTCDKYGTRWTAAVKWGRIGEDFNHNYDPDNNSNFSYQCQFNCILYFYEVYDESSYFIREILYELEAENKEGEYETIVKHTI